MMSPSIDLRQALTAWSSNVQTAAFSGSITFSASWFLSPACLAT